VGARRETTADVQWLNERREILNKIKGQVRLYLGEEPPDVTLYAQSYKNDIERDWEHSSMVKIHEALLRAQVVYGGDFHPFAQAQRSHLRLIRELIGQKEIILGMECFFADQQEILDQYVFSDLSEADFLKKTQWDELWGFPWKFYKPLVEFAKKNKIKILGLNKVTSERSGESLNQRDKFAAEIIGNSLKSHPEHLHFVIFGDLHIAENHLPRCVQESVGVKEKIPFVSLYLNSESIYFELARQGKEGEVEVVQFNQNQFCILSSPPWVKWQSYLMYLEENFDIDLDDEEDWEQRIDHTDHVSSLVGMICSGLGIELKTHDIEVYSLRDPQVLKVTKRILAKFQYELAHALVQQDISFYVPQKGFFYLSKSTVNHAASLAGKYIHGKLGKRNRLLWNFPDDFLSLIWVEAMSFMLSKFVNPKRKAQTMGDLKKKLEAFDSNDRGREPLLLALDQKMSELLRVYKNDERAQSYKPSRRSSYAHAARFLGEILGERYFVLYHKGIIGVEEIKFLLRQDLENKAIDEFYFEQLKLLDKLELEG
jgi:thermostable 8-oxoguanine DNA glycosylase